MSKNSAPSPTPSSAADSVVRTREVGVKLAPAGAGPFFADRASILADISPSSLSSSASRVRPDGARRSSKKMFAKKMEMLSYT